MSVNLSGKLIAQLWDSARKHPYGKSFCLARGRSAIDDLYTLMKIELIFIDEQTDAVLLDRIKREGVVLYERP